MPPSPGDQLGPYTITDKIGEGGMGEVYRATDTNLKRDVAIKFLPEAFTKDPERLARFQREAEVLAQLHHPNIASIFGIETAGSSTTFVQTEAEEDEPALSPDGRFVAYSSEESGTPQIYVKPLPDGSRKRQVSVEHGWRAYWSPTGNRLYYSSYGKLMEVEVSTDPVLRLGTPRVFLDPDRTSLLPWLGIDIAQDGKQPSHTAISGFTTAGSSRDPGNGRPQQPHTLSVTLEA